MDYILIWNSLALHLNRRDHTGRMNAINQKGPTRSSRALAMVHVAMHDAYFGIKGTNTPGTSIPGLQQTFALYTGLPGPGSTADIGAAVTAAAATVLTDLYPEFSHIVDEAVGDFGFSTTDPGWKYGEQVGKKVIQDRSTDGAEKGGMAPKLKRYWRHREDPTNLGQGLLGENWGLVQYFSAKSRPTLKTHPIPRSKAYNLAHDYVRVKGSRLPTPGTPGLATPINQRTPGQTVIGYYWAYDGASQIGTPPRLYNQIVRTIAANAFKNKPERMAAHARLFALINVAMADAGIASWWYKYHFQLWRPILGIREYDDSFWAIHSRPSAGIHKRADPFWQALGAPATNEVGKSSFTPPFPAYPSGHATFGAACFEMVRLFLGTTANNPDTISFELVSDELDGRSIDSDGSARPRHRRLYHSLLDAMFENAVSRVFLGVHWRFDGLDENVKNGQDILGDSSKIGGVPLGREIAQNIFGTKMSPSTLRDPSLNVPTDDPDPSTFPNED